MTRRPGKAPPPPQKTATSSFILGKKNTTRSHFTTHLYLTNCIHICNHLHRQASANLQLMRELKPSQKARSLQDPVVTSTPLVAASSGASSLLGPKKLHRLTRDDAGGGAAPSENSGKSQSKATSNQRNALLLQRASKASASPLPVQHRNSDDTRTKSQGANGKWIMEKKQQHPAAYHLEGELQIEAGSATTTRIDEFSTQGSRLRSLSLYEEVVNHHHPWSNGGGSRDWSVERKASSDSQKRVISSVKYSAAAGNRRKDKEKDAQEGWEGDAAATAKRRDLNLVKQRIVSEEWNNNAHPGHRDLHCSDPGESMFQTEEDEEEEVEEEEEEEEVIPVERQSTIWSKRGRASSSSSRRHEGSSPLLLTKQSRATTNRSKLHTEKSKPETATMPILEETVIDGLREGRRQPRGGGSSMKKKTTQQQYRDDEPPQQQQQQVLPVNPPVVVYNELELLLQQGCGRPPWERSSNKKNHEGKPSVGNPVAKLVTKKKKKTTPAVQRKRKVNTAAGASSKTGLISLSQQEEEEEEEEEDYYLGRSTASPLPLLINKDDESHDSDSTGFVLELAPSSTTVVVSSHAEQELGSKRSLGVEDRHGVAKEEGKSGGLLQNAAKIATTQQLSQAQEKQMHRTLSQKYRPKFFDELVGQGMVVKTLSMAILKDKVAPAYLFTGPSGTGKTTTARIFAAALNCLASESRPCGNCQQCGSRSHQNQGGGDSDVKEIDAASTNVDLATMRSSIMQQNFSSTYQARYKVFIVEGCHLLSTDIWNAFLKLLEEPPSSSSSSANVVFILITTESEQLPLTVISRCQRFSFCKLKESDIIKRLQWLAVKESLDVDKDAFSVIASRADGSLRDAEMILDQLSLLDKTVSSDMVRELVGLIPENKLLDLLDLALSANTVHTVRRMRQLLDLGVDPLSLASQLATLITDLLAGTISVQREIHGEGCFFKRNFSRKEELRRLRQALKVLSEAEKQLRVSGDRPTWLTAALLQFAPDRSFLSSSVNNSSIPQSPVSFKVQPGKEDNTMGQSLQSRGLVTMDEQVSASRKVETSQQSTGATAVRPLVAMYLEMRRKNRQSGIQAEAKVHPAESSLDYVHHQHKHRSQQQHQVGVSGVPADDVLNASKYSKPLHSNGFWRLHHRNLEDVWNQVLQVIQFSGEMQQLLLHHGNLLAVHVANDDTYAIAQLEFQQLRHKVNAERSRSQICHAFQMVLNCPVELQLSLARSLDNTVDSGFKKIARNLVDSSIGPSPSDTKDIKLKGIAVEENSSAGQSAVLNSSNNHHQSGHKPRQPFVITEQESSYPSAKMQEAESSKSQEARRARTSRLRSESETPDQSNNISAVAQKEKDLRRSRLRSEREMSRQSSESFPRIKEKGYRSSGGEHKEWQALEPQYRGEKVTELQHQRVLDETQARHKRSILQKPPKTRGGGAITSDQQNLRLKPRRRSVLCWKRAYPPDKHKGKSRRRRLKGTSFFLKLVPCTRSKIRRP